MLCAPAVCCAGQAGQALSNLATFSRTMNFWYPTDKTVPGLWLVSNAAGLDYLRTKLTLAITSASP